MTQDELPPPAQESAPAPAPAPASAGARLAAARSLAGLTIEDVSRQLKLAPRQVVAIERDDYPSLPGRTFVRGFVRNYARLLKLDADDVVAALPDEAGMAPAERPGLAPLPRPMGELPTEPRSRRPASRWAIPAVLIAIVAAAAIYEFMRVPTPTNVRVAPAGHAAPAGAAEPKAPDAATAETPAAGGPSPGTDAASIPSATTPALPAAAPGNAPRGSASPPPTAIAPVTTPATAHATPLPNPLAVMSATTTTAATSGPATTAGTGGPAQNAPPTSASVPAPSMAAAPPATAPVAVPAPATRGAASLAFTFRGTSWIEVRDRTGQVVLSMTGNDGATREVSIAPGGELVVGNVAGLDVSWRGRPLDLSPHSRQNVARVRLD